MDQESPKDELLKALSKLEEFTEENLKEQSRFRKTIDLLQTLFFQEYREKKAQQLRNESKDLIKTIGLIKIYLPLIDKLKHGSEEEQAFAVRILSTIERYNQAAPETEEGETNLKIEIPSVVAYQKTSSNPKSLVQINSLFKDTKSHSLKPPSKQELDTLKMKAIRFVDGHEGLKERMMETAPTHQLADFDKESKTVTLMQTWSDLPGEVHRIVGAFKRESRHSIPIKDSFTLFLESIQPGHPYPSQHLGWAISHWLIPSSVLWIDQIPLLKPLIERKSKAAQGLLPKGDMNLKARKLYRFKKTVFDMNKLEYLAFQQELSQIIVKSSPYADDEERILQAITAFYAALADVPNPFETLSKAHEELNRVLINIPYEKIEDIRLRKALPALYQNNRDLRLDALLNLYSDLRDEALENLAYLDPVTRDYITLFGKIIADSAQNLLILQLSEKFMIKPQPLTDFDLKIQACTFKHLIDFLEELESTFNFDDPEEKEKLKGKMRSQIHFEIELFSSSTFERIDPFLQDLVEETVSYFHARFHAGES